METRRSWTAIKSFLFLGVFLTTSSSPIEAADKRCGVYCLYVALRGLGYEIPLFKEFERSLPPVPKDGYTMSQLGGIARKYGAHFLGVKTSMDNLAMRKEKMACIALLKEGHYVLISDFTDREITVLDPPHAKTIPVSTVGVSWDGEALLISTRPLAMEEDLTAGNRLVFAAAALIGLVALGGIAATLFRSRKRQLSTVVCILMTMWSSVGCTDVGPANSANMFDAPIVVPQLDIEKSEIDLGKVPLSSERFATAIVLKNKGKSDLRLERIVTSCGCAGISDFDEVILPGRSTSLSLGLDCAVPGARVAEVSIYSNDPIRSGVRVRLHWEPIGEFTFNPPSLDLGTVSPNAIVYTDVKLVRTIGDSSSAPLPAVKDVVCTPSAYLSCEPSSKPNVHTLRIRLMTNEIAETVNGRITVNLDGGGSTCILPVFFRVTPAIDIRPKRLPNNL